MDGQSSGNQPPPDASESPAAVKLPDEILQKQQVLRRHLQDRASPAFSDPVRAAELAGFAVIRQSRADPGQESRPTYFYNCPSIRQAILDAASRKASTIEKLRRCVSEGMEATKIVLVPDREGVRRSVEVPDQAARREWAQLCAQLENFLPGKGGNASSDSLSHEVAQAAQQEELLATDFEHELSRLSPADRFQLSQFCLKHKHLEGRIRQQVMAAKLGKSIKEFEDEVEQEVRSQMNQSLSRALPKPAATSCDDSQIATKEQQ
jgi:hypothetical protein